MKSVMLSIQPKWCELIARGEKTIEVRKSRPKIETPFKCYIYATKKEYLQHIFKKGEYIFCDDHSVGKFDENIFVKNKHDWQGKVIGEFVCDKIICSQAYFDSQGKNHLTNVFEEDIKRTCLTEYELWNYIAGKAVKANQTYDGYLWHISDLVIYDKPKELGEFKKTKERIAITCGMQARNGLCCAIDHEELCDNVKCCFKRPCPPQSWQYVEDL